jgi:hypothetical protein
MPQSGAAVSRGDSSNNDERRTARSVDARSARSEPSDRYRTETSDRYGGVPGRRTVTIRGQGAERYVPARSSRRRPERRYERAGFRPDRAAMWAVMLGVMLILAAAASAHA